MGLLNSLLNIAKKVAEEAIKQQESAKSNQPQQPAQAPAQVYSSQPPVDPQAYFAEILQTCFPQYGVQRNVPVTDLAGYATDDFKLYDSRPTQAYQAAWGAPYTFVLYSGTTPAGIVMLGSGHSHDSNVKYLIARMYAKKMGLPYINFYTQMPNEREYVISRIRKFMNA